MYLCVCVCVCVCVGGGGGEEGWRYICLLVVIHMKETALTNNGFDNSLLCFF